MVHTTAPPSGLVWNGEGAVHSLSLEIDVVATKLKLSFSFAPSSQALMAKKAAKSAAAAPKKAMKAKKATKKQTPRKKAMKKAKVRGGYEPDENWSVIAGTSLP